MYIISKPVKTLNNSVERLLNEYAWDLKNTGVRCRTVYLRSKRDNFDQYTDLNGTTVS